MTDETALAQELKEEGQRLFNEGLYEEAESKFNHAREKFAAEGNEIEAAGMVNNLGLIYQWKHEWDEAIAVLEEARATFARLGDQSREAQTLANLSRSYARKGKLDEAEECLRQAADIFGELGDEQRQGETLLEMGRQRWKAGDRSSSLATYETGLHTLEKPTMSQKALRGLLGLRNRLLGGQQKK